LGNYFIPLCLDGAHENGAEGLGFFVGGFLACEVACVACLLAFWRVALLTKISFAAFITFVGTCLFLASALKGDIDMEPFIILVGIEFVTIPIQWIAFRKVVDRTRRRFYFSASIPGEANDKSRAHHHGESKRYGIGTILGICAGVGVGITVWKTIGPKNHSFIWFSELPSILSIAALDAAVCIFIFAYALKFLFASSLTRFLIKHCMYSIASALGVLIIQRIVWPELLEDASGYHISFYAGVICSSWLMVGLLRIAGLGEALKEDFRSEAQASSNANDQTQAEHKPNKQTDTMWDVE
jgi:hypothetical protein